MKLYFKLTFMFFFSFIAASVLFSPGNAHAAVCTDTSNWGITTGKSSSDAGLVVHTYDVEGNDLNVSFNLYETSGKHSIWNIRSFSNYYSYNNLTTSTGAAFYDNSTTCSNSGYAVFGLGGSTTEGNRYALDCEQVTSPGGGNNGNPSYFHIRSLSTPKDSYGNPRLGKWVFKQTMPFHPSNGYTSHINIQWDDRATLDGYKQDAASTNYSSTSTLGKQSVSVSSAGSDIGNPFYFNGGSGNGLAILPGSHTVSVPAVTGYDIKYKICDSRTTSCAPGDFSTGVVSARAFNYTFLAYHSYHMRWRYYARPDLSAHIREENGTPSGRTNTSLTASATTGPMSTTIQYDAEQYGYDNPNKDAGVGARTYTYSHLPAAWLFDHATVITTPASTKTCVVSANKCSVSAAYGEAVSVTFFFKAAPVPLAALCVSAVANPDPMALGDQPDISITMRNNSATVWDVVNYKFEDANGIVNLPSFVNPGNTVTIKYTRKPTATGAFVYGGKMAKNGAQFGAACKDTIDVQLTYDYEPTVSAPGADIDTPGGAIAPGSQVPLGLSVDNNCDSPICFVAGPTFTSTLSGFTVAPNDDTGAHATDFTVASYLNKPGLPPITSRSMGTPTYTIPANAPDGTQYCFYATVAPGQNTDLSDGDPDDGQDIHITPSYCYEATITRNALVIATQGDVHSGGGIGNNCTLGSTAGSLNATTGSFGEYIASAAGDIAGFGSAKSSSSTSLTFSNTGINGAYGVICRPDLAAVAVNYPGAKVLPIVVVGGVATANVGNLTTGLYRHSGPLILTGGTINPGRRVTIYNDTDITINNDIILSSAPAAIANLPSFGLITGNGGDLKISNAVKNLHGFYNTEGYIDTCYQHDPLGPSSPSHLTGDCPNQLNVLGSLVGNQIYFWRTGASTGIAGNVVTENIRQSGLLYLAPPPAFETQLNSGFAQPKYQGERAPLY